MNENNHLHIVHRTYSSRIVASLSKRKRTLVQSFPWSRNYKKCRKNSKTKAEIWNLSTN